MFRSGVAVLRRIRFDVGGKRLFVNAELLQIFIHENQKRRQNDFRPGCIQNRKFLPLFDFRKLDSGSFYAGFDCGFIRHAVDRCECGGKEDDCAACSQMFFAEIQHVSILVFRLEYVFLQPPDGVFLALLGGFIDELESGFFIARESSLTVHKSGADKPLCGRIAGVRGFFEILKASGFIGGGGVDSACGVPERNVELRRSRAVFRSGFERIQQIHCVFGHRFPGVFEQ